MVTKITDIFTESSLILGIISLTTTTEETDPNFALRNGQYLAEY